MPFSRAEQVQTALWVAVGIGLLMLFYMLTPILTPFAVAAVFAYICDPLVRWLVTHRVPRPLAVFGVIIASGALILLIFLIVVPIFWREAALLFARLPELMEMINARLLPFLSVRLGIDLQLDVASVRDWLATHRETAGDLLPALLSRAREGGMVLVALATNLILIPIAMFYLLQEWPRLTRALRDIIPRPMLARTMRITGDIHRVLAEFLRGQLAVMLLLAIFYSVGLWLAGLTFALPVGIITGLMSFIPFIGFGGGLVLAIIAALLQGEGMGPLIGVAVVYGIGQLLETYALTPHLVGERIGLHPLAVIFALMAFGQLFGFVGFLIALPASAALLVGLREVRSAWLASPLYLGHSQEDTPSDTEPRE